MFCSAICRGATILQSAVVSRGSSKQDKNVGLKRVDRSRPAANNGSDSRSVQDRDPKLRVLRASVFIRVHPWLNRIQIGAALGLVVMLGGSLGPRQLLTPVAARTQPQDSAATIAMLEQRLGAYRHLLADWGGLTRYGSDD